MRNKIVTSLLAMGLATSLNASSFFSDNKEDSYLKFHNEIIKMFDNDRFFHFPSSSFKMNIASSYPKMNVFENKENYIFKFELAGLEKKDIKVTITDQNILTITGEKKELTKEEKKDIIRQEHSYGSFTRSISLPDDIDSDNIKVKYENGILQVNIEKDMKQIKNKIKTLSIE